MRRPHRHAVRPPSPRLRAGRLLGGLFGLVGLLIVPAAYFRMIAADPRARSVPMFLIMLLFFPGCAALVGFLVGGAGAALLERFRTPPDGGTTSRRRG